MNNTKTHESCLFAQEPGDCAHDDGEGHLPVPHSDLASLGTRVEHQYVELRDFYETLLFSGQMPWGKGWGRGREDR